MALIQIKKGDEVFLTADDKALFTHCTGRALVALSEIDNYKSILEAHGISTETKGSIEVVSVETKQEVELIEVMDAEIIQEDMDEDGEITE